MNTSTASDYGPGSFGYGRGPNARIHPGRAKGALGSLVIWPQHRGWVFFKVWPQRSCPEPPLIILFFWLGHLLAADFTDPPIANGSYLFQVLWCFNFKYSNNSTYLIGEDERLPLFSAHFLMFSLSPPFYWALNINNQPSLIRLIVQILIFFMPSTIKPKRKLMRAEEIVRVIKDQFCYWVTLGVPIVSSHIFLPEEF